MITKKLSHKTGWYTLPRDTKLIVAHYKDGTTKNMELWQYLYLTDRVRNKIDSIDIYRANEVTDKNQIKTI